MCDLPNSMLSSTVVGHPPTLVLSVYSRTLPSRMLVELVHCLANKLLKSEDQSEKSVVQTTRQSQTRGSLDQFDEAAN